MARYILIGIIFFIGLGIAMAPAGLIIGPLNKQGPVTLVNSRGTVWQGQAELVVQGRSLGILRWSASPTRLFMAEVHADWQLDQTLSQIGGQASWDGQPSFTATGSVDAQSINEWLDPYDIYLEGDFLVDQFAARLDSSAKQLQEVDGQVHWSGGLVRFGLSGILYEQTLPPMDATFKPVDGEVRGVVKEQGQSTPLMTFSLGVPGFIKIGLTKGFTVMLRRPWPGTDPDHTVVLEVEEQFL
jgi:hypothetical protein